jgi:hypothetical protein
MSFQKLSRAFQDLFRELRLANPIMLRRLLVWRAV